MPETAVPKATIMVGQGVPNEWAQAQADGPYIAKASITEREMAGFSSEARVFWCSWNHLAISDGTLSYRCNEDSPWRIALPRGAISCTVHLGPGKIEPAARQRYWWPNVRQEINDVCAHCRTCGEVK